MPKANLAQGNLPFCVLSIKISAIFLSFFVISDGPVEDGALFDGDVTVLPDEARAACAAAFAEVFAEAEAEEARDLEVAVRDVPERSPAANPCRVAGFYEAMRTSACTTTDRPSLCLTSRE